MLGETEVLVHKLGPSSLSLQCVTDVTGVTGMKTKAAPLSFLAGSLHHIFFEAAAIQQQRQCFLDALRSLLLFFTQF